MTGITQHLQGRQVAGFMLLVGIALVAAACSSEGDDSAVHQHQQHMNMPAGSAVSGQSIYQLESDWTDQDGHSFKLESFAGKPLVLAMVYTHCDHACPRIIADMRIIRDELEVDAEAIHFALVSIDPDRDTVTRLSEFGEETGLSKQGWKLLRSDHSATRELAAVFGVQYQKTSDKDFAHSNIINVLNEKGEIVHQQKGLGTRPGKTVDAIRPMLEK